MKKIIHYVYAKFVIVLALLFGVSGCTSDMDKGTKQRDITAEFNNKTNIKEGGSSVIINFKLNKIPKIASNQFAVWIEDLEGNYVRTLYATNFTAEGGYKERKESLPSWVKESDWQNVSKSEIDAVSGATLNPGSITLNWDCRDREGNKVKPGKYFYIIEGNIYWSDRELCKGEIEIGDKENKSEGTVQYLPETAKENGVLIENINAVYTPKN